MFFGGITKYFRNWRNTILHLFCIFIYCKSFVEKVRGWAYLPGEISKFCVLEKALDHIRNFSPSEVSSKVALKTASNTTPQSPIGIVGVGARDQKIGQYVTIRKNGETANPDVVGQLRYLDSARETIDRGKSETGPIAVHFPMIQ